MCFPPNRLTRKRLPYTYPTPTLEEAANEGSSRLEAGSSKPRKQKKSKRQGKKKKKKVGKEKKRVGKEQKGETPTLELGGRSQRPDQAR
jgi:hypothetical protein